MNYCLEWVQFHLIVGETSFFFNDAYFSNGLAESKSTSKSSFINLDKASCTPGFTVCNTIIIRIIADEDAAIFFQNAFPTLEKYIDHVHIVEGVSLNVPTDLQNEI